MPRCAWYEYKMGAAWTPVKEGEKLRKILGSQKNAKGYERKEWTKCWNRYSSKKEHRGNHNPLRISGIDGNRLAMIFKYISVLKATSRVEGVKWDAVAVKRKVKSIDMTEGMVSSILFVVFTICMRYMLVLYISIIFDFSKWFFRFLW